VIIFVLPFINKHLNFRYTISMQKLSTSVTDSRMRDCLLELLTTDQYFFVIFHSVYWRRYIS